MEATHVFAGVAVTDHEKAFGWYARLLGRPPDMLPKAGEAVWQLAESALVYVVADPARAGSSLLTVAVHRLDDQLAELRERGIETRIETLENGLRKILVRDPDGNTIGFFEAPASEDASGS